MVPVGWMIRCLRQLLDQQLLDQQVFRFEDSQRLPAGQ
jgi:hypothetical protein